MTTNFNLIDLYLEMGPATLKVKRHNNGRYTLTLTAGDMHTVILTGHKRNHKAFWQEANVFLGYFDLQKIEKRKAAERAAFAREFPQQFPATKRALTSGLQMGHVVESKPVEPWYRRKSEFPMGNTSQIAREYAAKNKPTAEQLEREANREQYRQSFAEFSQVKFAGI